MADNNATGAYVLMRGQYEDWEIIGLFESEDALNEYIQNNQDPDEDEDYCMYNAGFFGFLDSDSDTQPKTKRYYTAFTDMAKGFSHHIQLDDEKIQLETGVYASPCFNYEISLTADISHGYIVLDDKLNDIESLKKIIADKVYEYIANNLEVAAEED